MNEGWKDDAGKPRLDLLPLELVLTIARVLTFGATKCGDRDWERVIAWGRVFGTVQRYLWAWWGGEDADLEDGLLAPLTACGISLCSSGRQDGIVSCSGSRQ